MDAFFMEEPLCTRDGLSVQERQGGCLVPLMGTASLAARLFVEARPRRGQRGHRAREALRLFPPLLGQQ